GRDQAGAPGYGGRRRKVRSQDLHSRGGGLLHEHQGTDAVVPVQQLYHGVLLQPGRVRQGGARSQSGAGDVAGSDGCRGEDQGAIKPVHQVMADAGEKFDPKIYIPAVAGYYTNTKGQMLSFPFNSSTTVFYYNQDAFAKAGLDPNRAPATWPEVMAAAAKIKARSSRCTRLWRTPAKSSIPRSTFPRWRATTRTPRDRCCRSRSTALPRCSITTRTRSPRRGSIPIGRRRRGRK